MGNSVTISAVANEEPELEFPTKVYSSLVQGFGRVNYMYSDEIIKNDILEVTATDADNDAFPSHYQELMRAALIFLQR